MIKKLLGYSTLLLFALSPNLSFSQGFVTELDFSNDKKGELRRCATDEAVEYQKANDPLYKQKMDRLRSKVLAKSNAKKAAFKQQQIPCTAGNTIVIPIAVHYDNSFDCSNIQCLVDAATNSIDALNLDFAATNVDIGLFNQLNAICPTGYPLSALGDGTCISYCLATLDHPTGEGLQNDQPAITIGKYEHSSAGGSGAAPWAGYLNIFVQDGTGLLGVANAPGQANGDGVMVDVVTWGGPGIACSSGNSVNTDSSFNLGRTLTHEIGHYLDLFHTFQGGCSNDDTGTFSGQVNVINDTPPTASSFFGCPDVTSFNSCADVPQSCSSTPTQFTNYMDYTNDACMVMFSQDQSTVMNGWANGLPFKTSATTCGSTVLNSLADCTITANFSPFDGNTETICLDDTDMLQLTDATTNGAVSWNWSVAQSSGNLNFTPNGNSFSVSQNPALTFTSNAGTSGVLIITLDACDVNGVCSSVTNTVTVNLVAGDNCPDFCDYTLELTDTFGDGWNGASLDVQQNGASIPGSPFTFTSGSTSGLITIQLIDGVLAEFNQTTGDYPSEEGFIVTDPVGVDIVNIPSNAGSGVVASFVTNCNAVVPTCTDNIQNGDEEGIDCGGSNCAPCSVPTGLIIGSCFDFDNGIPSALIQSQSDDFDWSIGTSTPSSGTGPQNGDNTSGAGQFLYIETSSPVGVGEIVSFSTGADLSGALVPYLNFYYDMFGVNIGTLNVYAFDGITQTNIFTLSGDQGSGWNYVNIDLSAYLGGTITLTFEAITNGSYEGDISIDDICLIDASQCSIENNFLTVSDCNNNGTPTDPADDYFTFSLDPSGILLGTTYTLSGDATGTGTYGIVTTLDNGGTGYPTGTDLNITITDDSDNNCQLSVSIIAPSSCSDSPGCGNIFVDSGGTVGNYGNTELEEYTICPTNVGEYVQLEFTFVDIEATTGAGIQDGCWDFLTIYDGNSTASPVLANTLCGELSGSGDTPSDSTSLLSPGDIFESTDTSGCLTVVFDSDGSETNAGWEANINCINDNICVSNLNITGLIATGVYQADDIIISNGSAGVNSAGPVSFYAGANTNEYILLDMGFECDGTIDFEAVNIECDPTD